MNLRVLALFSLAFASAASASLQLTLRLGSSTALPGVSGGMWLDVRNNGPSPAKIPTYSALEVRTASGEAFIPPGNSGGYWGEMHYVNPGPALAFELVLGGRSPMLEPDQTRTFFLHSGWCDPWLGDPRMEKPGTYRLRLVADDRIMGNRLKGLSRVLDQEGLVSPVVSNEVTLTIKEPEGDDAKVWGMRIDRGRGSCRWTFIGLEDQILQQYPRSPYAQFLHPRNFEYMPEEAKIEHLERSIAINPQHPIAESRRVELGHIYISRAYRAASARQLQKALVELDKGREILLGVVTRRTNPNAVEMALGYMPMREDFIASYHRRHSPRPVEVGLECVQPLPNGGFEAWLFYHNSTMERQRIPIGENNRFTPPPFDRGQPKLFARGAGWYFKVTSDGPDLTWHIDRTNLKISAKDLTDPPEYPDGEWETWTEEKEREKRKRTYRCRPGFEPDPEKLHSAAIRPGEED
jgi:hypothetical protein